MRRALPDLDELLRRGEFTPIREWLRQEIHVYGRLENSAEIIKRVSGEALSAEPLSAYLRTKFRSLYNLG